MHAIRKSVFGNKTLLSQAGQEVDQEYHIGSESGLRIRTLPADESYLRPSL